MSGAPSSPKGSARSGVGRRIADRHPRRLMVRFGVDGPEKTAFTKNLSETGLYLKTNAVLQPGTTIQVEVATDDRTFSMWGQVAWAKKVPPQLAHVLECGMGIRLLNAEDEWVEFVRRWNSA